MVTEREELTFIKRTSDHDSNEKQITIYLYFHKVLSFFLCSDCDIQLYKNKYNYAKNNLER